MKLENRMRAQQVLPEGVRGGWYQWEKRWQEKG
jgi:hypothetical protein